MFSSRPALPLSRPRLPLPLLRSDERPLPEPPLEPFELLLEPLLDALMPLLPLLELRDPMLLPLLELALRLRSLSLLELLWLPLLCLLPMRLLL